MISSFAYNRIVTTVKARAFDAGIEVTEVNPAYTSIIGRFKFARRYGISKHQAAAAVIARRADSLSEAANRHTSDQPTFTLPARNRAKHIWSFWHKVAAAEAAHEARVALVRRELDQSLAAGNISPFQPDLRPQATTRRNSGKPVGNTVRPAIWKSFP
jgi:hypothetical protein